MTNHVEDLKPASDSFIEDGDSSLRNMTVEDEKRVTKALLRKLDTRMLPMLAVLFLFSFLDRWVGSSLLLRQSCLRNLTLSSPEQTSETQRSWDCSRTWDCQRMYLLSHRSRCTQPNRRPRPAQIGIRKLPRHLLRVLYRFRG
jgi:hypothetical protein